MQTLVDLQAKVDALGTDFESSKSTLAVKDQRIEELESENRRLSENKEIASSPSEIEKLKEQNMNYLQMIERLEQDINALRVNAAKFEQQFHDQTLALERIRTENAKLVAKNRSTREWVKAEQKKSEAQAIRIGNLAQDLEKFTSILRFSENTHKKLAKAVKEKLQLQERLRQFARSDEHIIQLQNEKIDMAAMFAKARQKHRQEIKVLNSKNQTLKDDQNSKPLLDQLIETLQSENSTLSEEVSSSRQQTQFLQEEIIKLQSTCRQPSLSEKELTKRNRILKRKISGLKKDVKSLATYCNSLQINTIKDL
jgi:chromosome segregation ATPase